MRLQTGNPTAARPLRPAALIPALAGVLLLACGSSGDSGLPPPAARFTPDKPGVCNGEVSLQAGTISGTAGELQVRVANVQNVQAASFDLIFQTFRCSPSSQITCLTDADCSATPGDTCILSGAPVARFFERLVDDAGSFLNCGLPGELVTLPVLDPQIQDRMIVTSVRNKIQACSSRSLRCSNDIQTTCTVDTDCQPLGGTCQLMPTPCTTDFDCLPTNERCGGGESCEVGNPGGKCCVKPNNLCPIGNECLAGEVCEVHVCDAGAGGTGDLLLSLPFEILSRGTIRVDFDPDPSKTGLQDQDGNLIPVSAFCGGTLEGI